LGLREAFSPSAWQAASDAEKCTGCGVCAEERCPVKAIQLEDDVAVVDAAACIGCGLCVSTCVAGAMALEPRPNPAEIPATTSELGLKVVSEKGNLERFMAIMARAAK
jgi:ferredoxin